MGSALVKAWEAHAKHEAEVGDRFDEIRGCLTDKKLIISCVEKIHKFVTTKLSAKARDLHCHAVIRYKGIEILQMVMKEYPHEELVLRPIFQLLSKLAQHDACADRMRELDVKTQVIEIVRNNGDDPFILMDARTIFISMKASLIRLADAYLLNALEEKTVEPVLLALQNQPRELIVHRNAMRCMSNLMKDKEVALLILDNAAMLKQIMLTVARFRDDSEVQKSGFSAITHIAKADVRLGTLLGRVGAIPVIANNLRYLTVETVTRDSLQQVIWALNELGKVRKNKARLENENIGLILRFALNIYEQKKAKDEAEAEDIARSKALEASLPPIPPAEKGGKAQAGPIELNYPHKNASNESNHAPPVQAEELAEGRTPERPIVIPLKLKRLIKASVEADEKPESVALPDTKFSNSQNSKPSNHTTNQGEGPSKEDTDDEDDDDDKFVIREFDNTDSVFLLDELISEVRVQPGEDHPAYTGEEKGKILQDDRFKINDTPT